MIIPTVVVKKLGQGIFGSRQGYSEALKPRGQIKKKKIGLLML
jgi:hypothetical protein